MGIDYDANFGIGYEVEEGEEIKDSSDLEEGLQEYLYSELGDGFSSFEVGSAYSGRIDGVFIVIKEPFKDGLDLTNAKARLDKEINRLGLKAKGEFREVGGLYVC